MHALISCSSTQTPFQWNRIVTMRQMESALWCLGKEMPAHPITTMGQKTSEQAQGGPSGELYPGGH